MGDEHTENTLRGRDLAGLGGLLVAGVVGGMVIGLVVDEQAGTSPVGVLIGIAVGVVGRRRRLLVPRPHGSAGLRCSDDLRPCPGRRAPAGSPVTPELPPATTSRHHPARCPRWPPARSRRSGACCKDQRKALWVAVVLVVASFWVLGQLDRWTLGTSIAIGVLLGVVNHLATELWLLRLITSGDQPTRKQMITATLVRLGLLTVVAVGIADRLLARRFRAAARSGRLPTDRPDDDQLDPPEGAEEPMTLSRVRNAALVLAVVSFVVGIVMSFAESDAAEDRDRPPHHSHRRPADVQHRHDHLHRRRRCGRHPDGLLRSGAPSPRRTPTTSRPSSSCCGRRSSTRSTPRSRTTSARCTRS